MTPTLVLTRPEARSRALAAVVEAMPGVDARIIVAPIMEIVCTGDPPDLAPYTAIILTSTNAVHCGPDLAGVRVHCVGERTAAAARDAGADVLTVAQDADTLVGRISGPGPLLHLRGQHARGAVAQRLARAGTQTGEAVIYAQEARPLPTEARAAIEGEAAVVLPLFSPRSARLVGDTVRPGPACQVIAMSRAVADAWTGATGGAAEISDVPTGEAMLDRIVAALRPMSP